MAISSSPNGLYTLPEFGPVDFDLWGFILNDDIDAMDLDYGLRRLNLNFADYTLSAPLMKDVAEAVNNLGTTLNGAVVVDYTNGNYQYGTLSGNITSLSITNPPATGRCGFLTLELNQPAGANYTITLNSSVYLTPGDVAVTLTAANSAKDKLRLETRNAGTTWDVFTNLNIK